MHFQIKIFKCLAVFKNAVLFRQYDGLMILQWAQKLKLYFLLDISVEVLI